MPAGLLPSPAVPSGFWGYQVLKIPYPEPVTDKPVLSGDRSGNQAELLAPALVVPPYLPGFRTEICQHSPCIRVRQVLPLAFAKYRVPVFIVEGNTVDLRLLVPPPPDAREMPVFQDNAPPDKILHQDLEQGPAVHRQRLHDPLQDRFVPLRLDVDTVRCDKPEPEVEVRVGDPVMALPETGVFRDRDLLLQDMEPYKNVQVFGHHALVKPGLAADPGKGHAPPGYRTEDHEIVRGLPEFIVHQQIRLVVEIRPLVQDIRLKILRKRTRRIELVQVTGNAAQHAPGHDQFFGTVRKKMTDLLKWQRLNLPLAGPPAIQGTGIAKDRGLHRTDRRTGEDEKHVFIL